MKVREYIEAIETFGVITNYKGRKDRKAVSRVICESSTGFLKFCF